MRFDAGQSPHPPAKKQKIVEETEKVSSRVVKSKKQSDKLSKGQNLAGKVVPNVEMRDVDKASTASKEKLSQSKSDLDEIKSYVRTYVDMKFNDLQKLMVDQYTGLLGVVKEGFASFGKVAQYPVHESEKGNPDIKEDPHQSLNEHKMDGKSDNIVDDAGQSSKLGSNEEAAEESLKESEEALHNTDEDLSKAVTLYVPPSRAAYPKRLNYIDAAGIDICDRQGNIDGQCYISDNAIAAISQSKDKEVIQSHKKLKYPFEGHNINGPYAEDLFSKFFVWISAGLYNPHATKKGKDEYFTVKYADLKSSLDFVVAHPVKKSWFYYIARSSNCWNDEHIDVVFYYLRKKAKLDTTSEYKYTIVNCVFMNYIHDTYTHYHRSHSKIDLSSQDENVRSTKVASVERSICEIMQGLYIAAGIPWHLTGEVYVTINCKGLFYWVLAVIVLKERCIRIYDSMKGHRGHADEIKDLAEMLSTYLTIYDFFEKKDRIDWSLLDAYK
ncbi:hypothetical protein FXO37_22753 [Capsicum annuum]|nr:hypothetical protein FXO37_22753 [Capsicum annuum]